MVGSITFSLVLENLHGRGAALWFTEDVSCGSSMEVAVVEEMFLTHLKIIALSLLWFEKSGIPYK